MAHAVVPSFANDAGSDRVSIGVKEFKCMGARAPFDHPHVYLDMGADGQIICPYCSTLYVYNPDLNPLETDPPGCAVVAESKAA
ncbi:MAG: zinc-finger domain-containing protein [Hyphomicrobiaceae bacterium]